MSTIRLDGILFIVATAIAVIIAGVGFLGGGGGFPTEGTNVYKEFAIQSTEEGSRNRIQLVIGILNGGLLLFGYWAIFSKIKSLNDSKEGLAQLAFYLF